MKTLSRIALATLLAAATGAAAMEPVACRHDPSARGLTERVGNMQDQMNRIEFAAFKPVEQRRLLELHMKTMNEGLQEMRRRGVSLECRVELMHAMMEQMTRHQIALQDAED